MMSESSASGECVDLKPGEDDQNFDFAPSGLKNSRIPELFRATARIVIIKLQTVKMINAILTSEISSRSRVIARNGEILRMNGDNLNDVEELLKISSEEIDKMGAKRADLKNEYSSLQGCFDALKQEMEMINEKIGKAFEYGIAVQNTIDQLCKEIESMNSKKEMIRNEIINTFAKTSPLKNEAGEIAQALRQNDKEIIQLTVSRNELEKRLSQRRSEHSEIIENLANILGYSQSTVKRISQDQTEIMNLEQKIKETTNLFQDHSVTLNQTNIEKEGNERENLKLGNDLSELVIFGSDLQNEYNRNQEKLSALENRIEMIHQEVEREEIKYGKIKEKKHELDGIHCLRALQLATFADSLREKSSKLESNITKLNAELQVVHQRNHEQARMLKTFKKQIPSRTSKTNQQATRSRLFPSC